MKKISKKLIAMVMSIVLLISIVPITALAATTVDSGNFGDGMKWSIDSDGVLTVSGKGEIRDFDEDMPPWFPYVEYITSIVIADGVTRVGNYAFALCSYATKVTLPSSVTSIGDFAFTLCVSLEKMTLSSNLKSIGDYALSFCVSLEGITLPNSMEYIGEGAFQGCTSITSVNIPANLETIGFAAFAECYSLASFTVNSNNPNYTVGDKGILFNKDKDVILCAPSSLKGNYAVPNTVIAIDSFAFTNSVEVESISIPASVTAIGLCAFFGASSIKAINVDAANENYFSDANGVLFDKEKTMLHYAPVSITGSYTVPDGVKLIDTYAFAMTTGLTEIIIPDSVIEIGHLTFASSNITTVTIPAGVTYIGEGAFSGCPMLESVYFEGDAPEVGIETPTFDETITTIYYPEGNETWTNAVRESFGGDITWKTYTPAEEGIVGDVDNSGDITNADLIMIARYIVGLETNEDIKKNGDMDANGDVTNADLIALARIIVGIVE